MKKNYKLYLSTLAALSISASAYADQAVTAPTLEGGVTASLGAMWVAPSVANDDYATTVTLADGQPLSRSVLNVDPDYEFGMLASLGYVFENTANMVELSYRGLFDSSSTSSASVGEDSIIFPNIPVWVVPGEPNPDQLLVGFGLADNAKSKLEIEHHSVDLMFSQFMNLGENTQIRFSIGASYLDYEQKQSTDFNLDTFAIVLDGLGLGGVGEFEGTYTECTKTDFSGFGPRLGLDGRYDFGEGFGIVAGGSAAYYIGDLDTRFSSSISGDFDGDIPVSSGQQNIKNNKSDHAVTNLRGNIGVDYVYFLDNEERSTIGIELGYMVDWYDNLAGEIEVSLLSNEYDTHSVTFSGPYLSVKGAF